MANQGIYTNSTWVHGVQFNTPENVPLALSGTYECDVLRKGDTGTPVFSFNTADGTLDHTDQAVGRLVLTATPAQHQPDVTAGKYMLYMRRVDGGSTTWAATGEMVVGKPGDSETYIRFDAATDGSTATTYAVALAGPPGTTEWDDLVDKPSVFPPDLTEHEADSDPHPQYSLKVGNTYYDVAENNSIDLSGSADCSTIINELLGDGVATGSGGDGVNALPVGTIAVFKSGIYKGVFRCKRFVNIDASPNALFRTVSSSSTDDVFSIDVEPGLSGYQDVPRSMVFSGGITQHTGTAGRNAISVMRNGGLAQFQLKIANGVHNGFDSGGAFSPAIYMTGYSDTPGSENNGPTFCIIEGNNLNGGIHLETVADGNRILNNNIFGKGAGVKLDVVEGGYLTTIAGNAITSRDGALDVIAGSNIKFHHNQCEQGGGLVNAGTTLDGKTAMVFLRGSSGRIIKGFHAHDNNYGCGVGLVDTAIVADYVDGAIFEESSFFRGVQTYDVRLTANCKNSVVDPFSNWVRGPRTTGYSSRDDLKFVVSDAGVANVTPFRDLGASMGGYLNSWGGVAYVRRSREGELVLDGLLLVGTTGNSNVGTLPVGFRPDNYIMQKAFNQSTFADVNLIFWPDGTVNCPSATAGQYLNVSGIRVQMPSRIGYDGTNG